MEKKNGVLFMDLRLVLHLTKHNIENVLETMVRSKTKQNKANKRLGL